MGGRVSQPELLPRKVILEIVPVMSTCWANQEYPEANCRDTQYPTAAVPRNKASSLHPARKTRRRELMKHPTWLQRIITPGLRRVERNTPDSLPAKKHKKYTVVRAAAFLGSIR